MSIKLKKIGSLQIEPEAVTIDPIFNKVRHIGILIMGLLLLGALLGLFGPGMLGNSKIDTSDFEINYLKFPRVQSTSTVTFYVKNTSASKLNTHIWVSNDFFKKIIVKNIIPRPILEENYNDGKRYTFQTQPNMANNIILVVEPEKFGILSSKMSINDSAELKMNQFIYP